MNLGFKRYIKLHTNKTDYSNSKWNKRLRSILNYILTKHREEVVQHGRVRLRSVLNYITIGINRR